MLYLGNNVGINGKNFLLFVLWFKILVTFVFWSIPLIIVPKSLLIHLGMPVIVPNIFARLLGCSYLSLNICYILGYIDLKKNIYPRNTVIVGSISNSLAFAFLLGYSLFGFYDEVSMLARIYLYISMLLTFLITLGLLYSLRLQRKQIGGIHSG